MPLTTRLSLAVAIGLLLLLPFTARQAVAQSASDAADRDDRSDRIQDQEDAIDAAHDLAQARQEAGQAIPPGPKEFTFRVSAPLYSNSNAEEVQSGGSAALEGDPEIEAVWARNLTSLPMKLSVRLRADTDRYANAPQANEDEASGMIKASYYDAGDDQAWAPFFSYKSAAIFDATFSSWTETKNDLALGVDRIINFDGGFDVLPAGARSRVSATWSLGFTAYVQRRLHTPGSNSTALYVVPSATYVPSKDWSISLYLTTRERWFDSASSTSGTTFRRDFEIEPILTVAYDPSATPFGNDGAALQRRFGSPQIALQIGFERRSSNETNKSWNQWTVGPVLTANWKF
jgi:hypothetical protein